MENRYIQVIEKLFYSLPRIVPQELHTSEFIFSS